MSVLLALSNGFNEIEASTVIEILNAGGVDVTVAGMPGAQIAGSHGLSVMTQVRLSDVDPKDYSAIIFPGGNSHYISSLSSSMTMRRILDMFNREQKWIAAINNSPLILLKYGLIVEGTKTCTHSSIERKFPNPRPGPVMVDKNFITAGETSSAIDFALKVLEVMKSNLHSRRVREYYSSKLPARRAFQ